MWGIQVCGKKIHGGTKDTRRFRWSAKGVPPVSTSFDHFVDNTGHGQTSYLAAREAAAMANPEEMDSSAVQSAFIERAVAFKNNLSKVAREYLARVMAYRSYNNIPTAENDKVK